MRVDYIEKIFSIKENNEEYYAEFIGQKSMILCGLEYDRRLSLEKISYGYKVSLLCSHYETYFCDMQSEYVLKSLIVRTLDELNNQAIPAIIKHNHCAKENAINTKGEWICN